MAINKVNLTNGNNNLAINTATAVDTESKNIQNQLTNQQRRLNQLSSDSEMNAEEKAKERQKIQQQIAELNRKLRLHRMEQQEKAKEAEEEQEKKIILKEEMQQEIQKEQSQEEVSQEQEDNIKDISMPVVDIQKMLAADSLLQQERVRESVSRQKEGKVNVLEAEIGLDALYGTDNTAKKEELAEMRKQKPVEIEVKEQQADQNVFGINSGTKIIIRE